ncbi:MAG: 2-oxoacid:acceptor oxidoreductase family protein [Desulfurococcaceae archaeon]
MKQEILVVGRGGQGVLLLGRILGLAATKYAGLYAVVTESYSAETRGGESRSDIIIASSIDEIEYNKVLNPNIAVFMFPFYVERYKATMIKPHTLIIVDEDFVNPDFFKGYRVASAKFSGIAEKVTGTRRVANMVILGKLLREIGVIGIEHVKAAISELVSPRWLDANFKALEAGYNMA